MIEPNWAFHCAEHAAAHVERVTGRNIWREFGGCPHSPREAADFYRTLGVTSLREAVGKVLGDEIPPAFAMRGDVVMAQNALGICRGDLAEFVDRMLPMHAVECAWRTHPKKVER